MQIDRQAVAKAASSGNVFIIIGWILVALSALLLIMLGVSAETDALLGGVCCTVPCGFVPGILLIILGNKRKRMAALFEVYLGFLQRDPTSSLDNLAGAANAPVLQVQANIQYMIKLKFFPDAFISNDRRLTFRSESNMYQPTPEGQPMSAATQQSPKSVYCPGCGASIVVMPGGVTMCEYCQKPVSYQ